MLFGWIPLDTLKNPSSMVICTGTGPMVHTYMDVNLSLLGVRQHMWIITKAQVMLYPLLLSGVLCIPAFQVMVHPKLIKCAKIDQACYVDVCPDAVRGAHCIVWTNFPYKHYCSNILCQRGLGLLLVPLHRFPGYILSFLSPKFINFQLGSIPRPLAY